MKRWGKFDHLLAWPDDSMRIYGLQRMVSHLIDEYLRTGGSVHFAATYIEWHACLNIELGCIEERAFSEGYQHSELYGFNWRVKYRTKSSNIAIHLISWQVYYNGYIMHKRSYVNYIKSVHYKLEYITTYKYDVVNKMGFVRSLSSSFLLVCLGLFTFPYTGRIFIGKQHMIKGKQSLVPSSAVQTHALMCQYLVTYKYFNH